MELKNERNMLEDIDHVLVSGEQLKARIAELGEQLATEYDGRHPVFLGVLKGVVNFFNEMVMATPIRCQYDFMVVSSYGAGTSTSGTLHMSKDCSIDIKGRDVVILEDILDTGLTLKFVKEHLLEMEPASLKICTMLDKPSRRKVDIEADYVGFTVPNEFVVGCGLDYDEDYRNLPFIGVLKPEVYAK